MQAKHFITVAAAGAVGLVTAVVGPAVTASASPSAVRLSPRWVNAWQGSPVQGATIQGAACPADKGLTNQTVRNVVFLSAGGDRVRVRLTNAFGLAPLHVNAASVAVARKGAAAWPNTVRALHFGGRPSIVIAAGGEALSDPVSMRVRALQTLDVSVYFKGATGPASQHWDAQQDNYLAAGNQAFARAGTSFATKVSCWMFVDGVDVRAAARVRGTVVALGDSITDGYLSTTNANTRYPDFLARRLNAVPGRTLSVSNAGISGNDLLTYRTDLSFGAVFGPPAPARLARDVLTQPGARAVILLEGINDIGAMSAKASDLIQADRQIIAQAHLAGLRIYGATLTPFGGSHAQYKGDYGTAAGERQRELLNRWIRTSHAFDGVFDFDKALRDPKHPHQMLPRYDSGDHLHPSDRGYRVMANTVNLRVLLQNAR